MTILDEFKDFVGGGLWQQFLMERSELGQALFLPNWGRIGEEDAHWFLKTMKAGLFTHSRRGLYRALRSGASEQFFWTGPKTDKPRRVFLWAEPIITVAALGKLHFTHGWPKELLGTQANNWEFDLAAFKSTLDNGEYVACEVKKSIGEVDALVGHIRRFLASDTQSEDGLKGAMKNAFRKLKGLRDRNPEVFWVVGPGGYGKVFSLDYSNGLALNEVGLDVLKYS